MSDDAPAPLGTETFASDKIARHQWEHIQAALAAGETLSFDLINAALRMALLAQFADKISAEHKASGRKRN